MNISRFTPFFIIPFFCSILLSKDTPDSLKTRYERLYDQFIDLQADKALVADVNGLSFDRDVAKFTMSKGKVYFFEPVEGRVCAAVFIGEGTFQFSPPGDVEEDQLYRFTEKRHLEEKVRAFEFLFDDSTFEELKGKLTFHSEESVREATLKFHDALSYMGEKSGKSMPDEVIKPFIEQTPNGMFYAQCDNDYCFEIDPSAREEVSLRRKEGVASHRWTEIINMFHRKEYYSGVATPGNDLGTIDVHNYLVDAEFRGHRLETFANATVDFSSRIDGQQAVTFDLYPELKIDSVFWEDGKRARVFQGEDNYSVWIDGEQPLRKHAPHTLRFYYHGELVYLEENSGWVGIRSPDTWFPANPVRKKATFDVTLHSPSRYTIVGTGERKSFDTKNDIVTGRWVTPYPARNVSFNIGMFKPLEVKRDSVAPVTIYITDFTKQYGDWSDMEQRVGEDLTNGLKFFGTVYGDAPMKEFTATEIPYAHGEAFPGMIHLSATTFNKEAQSGFDQLFRAHEVAHQWWGIGLDWETYHDRWLSEAFAEFSGLWFMQAELKDNDKYFDMLKTWRTNILGNRKYLFGSGQEAGPISLGYRTQSSKTSGDYSLIIYEKGAWVLHMLRNMLINQQTMNEDIFRGIMHDFYTKYRDTSASTTDFEHVVESHMKADMGWFFKEWINGTHIPHYKVSYNPVQNADGKYTVSCRIDDDEAPADFQMVIPLYLDFGQSRFARLRVLAKGPHSEFNLPPMPLKPEKIKFNDLESVLCEVDEVDWKN